METIHSCPACRQPGALVALGTRRDRLHRWRPWVTTITHLYLCERCDAIVAIGQAPQPAVGALRKLHGRVHRPLLTQTLLQT